MGVNKSRRPILAGEGVEFSTFNAEGVRVFTEAVTLTGALSTLSAEGLSFITNAATATGSGRGSVIPNPPQAGAEKRVVVDNQTTSLQVAFFLASTGASFFGSTNNTATVAVDSTDTDQIPWLNLVGRTTGEWALQLSSTAHWSLSKSTGSTGQG